MVGCEYAKGGVTYKEFGPVVFASGGFGADFGQDSLLAKYRPDLLHLPTTNGEHCTGDGIKLGEAIGAKTIDLEWVQVHPTGLVKPDDPDAKVKFLAAEALRGVGGLVLDMNGKRFANELGRRDYVHLRSSLIGLSVLPMLLECLWNLLGLSCAIVAAHALL